MGEQWAFYFDTDKCIGCHACSVSCKQRHGRDSDSDEWRTVKNVTTGTFPDVSSLPISMSCMHCADAPCEKVCPCNSIVKREEDGIVTVDRDSCIGCHYCGWACPYGAPTYDDGGIMSKCNMCLGEGAGGGHGMPPREEQEDGGSTPACVDNCVGDAIKAGPVSELKEQASASAMQAFAQEPANIIVEADRDGDNAFPYEA